MKQHLGSPQFKRLYRGLHDVTPEQVEEVSREQGVGYHWTPSFNTAYNFATYRDPDGWTVSNEHDEIFPRGTVVEAYVHKKNIIDPDSAEGEAMQDAYAVLPRGGYENEHTVRPGSPLNVVQFHFFDDESNISRIVTPKSKRKFKA